MLTQTAPPAVPAARPTAPRRPAFSVARAIEWAIFPLLSAFLSRARRADGSYPAWVVALPNALTLSRLLAFPLAAGFVWAVVAHRPLLAAYGLAMIGLMYFTDAIDGAVARFIGPETSWGMKWDPILDKLAGMAMFAGWLALVHRLDARYFAWFLGLVLARIIMDLALAAIALREDHLGLKPKARIWGKLKAACDDLAVITGYAGATVYAASHSGLALTLVGGGFLLLACAFAPMSLYEHCSQLRHRARLA